MLLHLTMLPYVAIVTYGDPVAVTIYRRIFFIFYRKCFFDYWDKEDFDGMYLYFRTLNFNGRESIASIVSPFSHTDIDKIHIILKPGS